MATMEQIYWIQPDGVQRDLMDIPNVVVQPGRIGWDMPPIEHTVGRIPLRHGARHRQILATARRLDLPLFVGVDSTWEALRDRIREIEAWFYPSLEDGPGKIRVVYPDGTGREINCYYEAGLQGNDSINVGGLNWRNYIIILYAADPFWYDTAPVLSEYSQGSPATFFPLLPLKLLSTNIFGSALIDNTGDLEVYPIWTITGPMTRVIMINNSYSPVRTLEVESTLLTGETITIDTREGYRTVIKNDGTNKFADLIQRDLWPLKRGVNDIEIQMDGATVDSRVNMEYTPRYLSV